MIKNDEYFMNVAINIAKESRKSGNEPFGAVLVKDNEIMMTGGNEINTLSDPTSHAELGLIRKYCVENNVFNLKELTLYTSCEPCVMCSGAMVWSNLGKVVYSVSHSQLAEIAGSNIMISSEEVFNKSPNKPVLIGPILNEKGLEVFNGYKFE